ncbi:MAG TPA: amidase family protein [Kineosporiaceae bacterium]|nr:amidase family protein [Kineosporiaceae bacterium]
MTGPDGVLTGLAVARRVSTGQVSAVDFAAQALARLHEVDPVVRAFTAVRPRAEVLADAAAVDRAVAAGQELPLAGVPIGVKASQALGHRYVRRLVAAGAVPVGFTSIPTRAVPWQTWGHTDRGPTRNPHRPDLTPGGSSAGSGAAVAMGAVPVATGSDGAGSVRIPAAWCGLVGVKPTAGTLPAGRFAEHGCLTRTVGDAWTYLDVVSAGAFGRTSGPDRPGLTRLVWSADLGYADVDPEIADLAHSALRRLAAVADLTRVDVQVCLLDPRDSWLARREAGAAADSVSPQIVRDQELLRDLLDGRTVLATPTTPNRPHGHAARARPTRWP